MVKFGVTLLAFLLVADGLWSHDWRMILAGAATAAIWPLINADLETVRHEARLDALWNEDEAA